MVIEKDSQNMIISAEDQKKEEDRTLVEGSKTKDKQVAVQAFLLLLVWESPHTSQALLSLDTRVRVVYRECRFSVGATILRDSWVCFYLLDSWSMSSSISDPRDYN